MFIHIYICTLTRSWECRWQIRCLGTRRKLEQATSTSQRCDTTSTATPYIVSTRMCRTSFVGRSRREEKTLEHGDKHVTSPLWPSQRVKVGTLMPYSTRTLVFPFGTFRRSSVSFVTRRGTAPPLRAPCPWAAPTFPSRCMHGVLMYYWFSNWHMA